MATAVILAGGKSRRMGRDKTLLSFQGQSLVQRAVDRFSAVFENVLLSVGDAEKYPALREIAVADVYPGRGPMAGLHASLTHTEDDGVFLVAADMPFADPRAAAELVRLGRGYDACALLFRGRPEPLFAWYSRALLPAAEALLRRGEGKMAALLNGCRLNAVEPARLGALWDERTLLNVNFPEDYAQLLLKSENDVV